MKPIGNTGYDLLLLAHGRISGVTAIEAVSAKYPQSKQPLKKAKTFYGYLWRMARDGLLVAKGDTRAARYTAVRFTITAAGRQAGLDWQRRRSTGRAEAPTFPRLAR